MGQIKNIKLHIVTDIKLPSTQHNMPSFAQKQMQRYGWSEGKGLGRKENGMKSAIKVKLKNNTGGLGHDQGAEFSFHWWDHIFNKAASSFKVNETEDGVSLEKCEGKKFTPLLITNKRGLPTRLANKTLLYGTFVKAGTYDSNKAADEVTREFSSDSSDSDDDDDVKGDKGLINDTLQKMFLKTGLTGHKAARHGHSLNGKLQRLTQQEERELPKSINTDLQESTHCEVNETDENTEMQMHQKCKGLVDITIKPKKKKKKGSSDSVSTDLDKTSVDSDKVVSKRKKRKKLKMECDAEHDALSPSVQTELGESVSATADITLQTNKSLAHRLEGENICLEQQK